MKNKNDKTFFFYFNVAKANAVTVSITCEATLVPKSRESKNLLGGADDRILTLVVTQVLMTLQCCSSSHSSGYIWLTSSWREALLEISK